MTDTKDILRKIKLGRMEPHIRYLHTIIGSLELMYTPKRPGSLYYVMGSEVMIEQLIDGNYFWIRYDMWEKLYYRDRGSGGYKFDYNNSIDVKNIVSDALYHFFDIEGANVGTASLIIVNSWEKLILKKK